MSARPRKVDPTTLALHWNSAYPVGTLVDVQLGDRSCVRTRTTSAAWVSSPPWTAVVDVEGLTKPFPLSRVTPVPEGAAA